MPDPTPCRLRPARAADLDALVALEARFPGDRLRPRQFRHHLESPRACLRVLACGSELAGYALLLRRRGSTIARLYSIAIDPARRGQGLGARLLRDIEVQARRDGASALRLEVRVDNAAAIRLYERAGYLRFGQRPGYYEDGACAWRYQKRL